MKHVVVVDDSEIVTELLKSALEAEGVRVTACLEPEREVVAGADPPDLILLDINMPQYFGDDVAAFFRDAWQVEAPIYLFSDIDEADLKARTEEAGVAGYIWKGWGMDRVVERILDLLGADAG
ncbi:MAG: response regulator [Deltaproteobacteria bacterium]|nr:MAG: response regulator [Deltaproteobacteria bacterium]